LSSWPRLRPYQLSIYSHVLGSALNNEGLSFSVQLSRQAGKNEISAQLEATLLGIFKETGGTIIKTAPTRAPQLHVSRRRLLDRLRTSERPESIRLDGDTIHVGAASITFLSGQPDANVAGHTASLLLEVDEAQDMDRDKFEKDFRPMILATGATVVFYGTAWDPDSLLEQVKAYHLALEAEDGAQRHFQLDYEAVALEFPPYLNRALAQRDLLGADSPIFLSQYCLLPQEGLRRFFTREQLTALHGAFPEFPPGNTFASPNDPSVGAYSNRPSGGGDAPAAIADPVYVAGLDIGGHLPGRRRDPTVLTIIRFSYDDESATRRLQVVKHRAWQSTWDQIEEEIVAIHAFYPLEGISVDSTGLGNHPSALLQQRLGKAEVEAVNFSEGRKSELGYQLAAVTDAGLLQVYAGNTGHSRRLWQQLEHAQVEYRANEAMNFFVPERFGHDDYLISLALAVHAAASYKPRRAYAYSRGSLM
jgi:hypothetical protein